MYIKPVWSVSNQMQVAFYDSGKSGGRECIKSLECQIGWIRGDYRQLEFEESVREQREKELEQLISVNCCTGAVANLQGAVLIRFSIVGVQKSSESYFDGSEWRRVAMLIVVDSRNGRDSPRYLTIVPPACHPHFTTVASILLPFFQSFISESKSIYSIQHLTFLGLAISEQQGFYDLILCQRYFA